MLFKLSITGIKSRLRDYIILFSGLMIAASIFYMFESLATNEAFLKNSNTVSMAPLIFRFGTVLLAIITFVYILYANSFLMMLRQKTYAMFLMLGAKKKKITQLIFIETFVVGLVATFVGILLGIGLTTLVSRLLVEQLNITVSHFNAVSLNATVWTLFFFVLVFFITSVINASSVMKKTILALLKEQSTPKRIKQNSVVLLLETIVGLFSLVVAYYMLANIETYQLLGIGISLVTVIVGSYLLFHAVALFALGILKKADSFSMKKINNFILSQLSFRIRDFTQMLTMVSILFALAMGALTVGLGFRNQIMIFTNEAVSYDLTLNNAQEINQAQVRALDPTSDVRYTQKEDEQTVYYNIEEFNQHPFIYKDGTFFTTGKQTEKPSVSGEELAKNTTAQETLKELELPEQKEKNLQFVSAEEFNQLALPETILQLVNVKEFSEQLPQIKKIVDENNKNNPSAEENDLFSQKYFAYQTYNGILSGFQFMGFFLGLAFLTMLASCLMFKILSSAANDTARYQMLRKIGTRQRLLTGAIYKEIGVLFLLPGILGIIHVLFGLKMFKMFLHDPYQGIWLPFMIFLVLYLLYYVITVVIYRSIVLPKEQGE